MNTQKSLKERLGVWGIGFAANALIDYPFNYLLYPYVISKYGWTNGGIIMTLASLLVCVLTFKFYDWAKQDWIGLETLKETQDTNNQSFFSKIVKKLHGKYQWLLFIIFSLKTDPFVTTILMREGAHQYNGLSGRDWKVFLGSLFLGNLFWIWICSFGLETAKSFGLTVGQTLSIIFVIMLSIYIVGLVLPKKEKSKI